MHVGSALGYDGANCRLLVRVTQPFANQIGDRWLGVGGAMELPAIEREFLDDRSLEAAWLLRRRSFGKEQRHGPQCFMEKRLERDKCSSSWGSTLIRSGARNAAAALPVDRSEHDSFQADTMIACAAWKSQHDGEATLPNV